MAAAVQSHPTRHLSGGCPVDAIVALASAAEDTADTRAIAQRGYEDPADVCLLHTHRPSRSVPSLRGARAAGTLGLSRTGLQPFRTHHGAGCADEPAELPRVLKRYHQRGPAMQV